MHALFDIHPVQGDETVYVSARLSPLVFFSLQFHLISNLKLSCCPTRLKQIFQDCVMYLHFICCFQKEKKKNTNKWVGFAIYR